MFSEVTTPDQVLSFNYQLTSAEKIPEFYTNLVKLLPDLPLFTGEQTFTDASVKVISLDTLGLARICRIFNANARMLETTTHKKPMNIFNFRNREVTLNGEAVQHGLCFKITKETTCTADEVGKKFGQVYQKLTAGWTKESFRPEETPKIPRNQTPYEYVVYTKKASLSDEGPLIRLIRDELSLGDSIECKDEGDYYLGSNKIYLWIRKSEFQNVIDKFGFNLKA